MRRRGRQRRIARKGGRNGQRTREEGLRNRKRSREEWRQSGWQSKSGIEEAIIKSEVEKKKKIWHYKELS